MRASPLLRSALPQEAPVLSDIAHAAKAALGYAPELLRNWREELRIDAAQIRRHTVRVVQDGDRIIAFLCLSRSGADARLEHLWVLPGAQRQGVGTVLLREALRLAAAAGVGRMLVDAEPAAEDFYRRAGFTRVAAVAAPIPGDLARVRPQMMRPL